MKVTGQRKLEWAPALTTVSWIKWVKNLKSDCTLTKDSRLILWEVRVAPTQRRAFSHFATHFINKAPGHNGYIFTML